MSSRRKKNLLDVEIIEKFRRKNPRQENLGRFLGVEENLELIKIMVQEK